MGNGHTKKAREPESRISDKKALASTKQKKESLAMKPAATKSAPAAPADDDSSLEEELLACCLCHCAVDYADRDAFATSTKNVSDDGDPLLPESLYDAQNTLVWCEICNRPFHQRCHFVPILTPPRNTGWHCLICKSKSDSHTKKKMNKLDQSEIYPFPPAQLSLAPENAERNATSGQIQKITTESTEWELLSQSLKAHEWKKELSRLQRALSVQLNSVRLAQVTLHAYTSTRRAQQYLTLQSQELSQTLVKLTASKLKIKQLLQSLEQYRLGHDDAKWKVLQDWMDQQECNIVNDWFPFGRQHERRIVPRFHDGKETEKVAASLEATVGSPAAVSGVPTEVRVPSPQRASRKKSGATTKAPSPPTRGRKRSGSKSSAIHKKNDEDDDLISLDDLKCCICHIGDATDENDLLMCDGEGCFRAYHRLCLHPVPSMQEIEEQDDWFCPICTATTELIASVQSEYYGDDWEKKAHDDDTIVSWEHVSDVFPEAEHEYEMTMKWKAGKEDEETVEFLTSLLGFNASRAGLKRDSDEDDEEEDDDDPEDDDFDLEKFHNRSRDAEEEDGSVASSQATLQDMSSVELNIGRAELNALSSGESSDEEEESGDESSAPRPRRSRRRRASRAGSTASTSGDSFLRPDIGTLHESNIVEGKRPRKPVDYRKLNDSMFGDVSETEARKKLDDEEDFELKRRKSSSSSSPGNEDDSESGEEESGDESQSRTTASKAKEPKGGTKRKNGQNANGGKMKSSRGSSAKKEEATTNKPRRSTVPQKARSSPRQKASRAARHKRSLDDDAPAGRKKRRTG